MARTPAREQKKLDKALEREARKTEMRELRRAGITLNPDNPKNWPLHECLITANWRNTEEIIQVLIARRSSRGEIGAAFMLIDLACLGLKNGATLRLPTLEAFELGIRDRMAENQELVACSPDLVAHIAGAAREYAQKLGFKPHPDALNVLEYLGEVHPETITEKVPLGGPDGKPLFMSGPNDNVDRVVRTLEASVGVGNFEMVVQGPPSGLPGGMDGLTVEGLDLMALKSTKLGA